MDEEKVYYTIILRHDTSTNWMMNNPILALSEYGVEDDTHRVKRGDGQSNWADLPYEHFGLEYLVTFENLIGDVTDNENLKTALDNKINNNIFSENANGVIENIILTDEENTLAKITRVTKDVVLGSTRLAYLKVISKDNSIQGIYSVDEEGVRVLNLQAYSHINDYEVGKTYHINELCYYDNRLYRAVHEEFVAEESFTKAHWVLLASLHSNDIKYNHLISGLEADTVKDALDELQDLDSQKVKKTNRENKVYGTNELGEQYLYNKDDLRKVDTVNRKQADLNKNVQIDASDINYTDTDPSKGTVRQVLDSKVDKTVAGAGAKIVRDVQFNYDPISGHIVLREDKFSLEDGASATEEREIDVVSEKELQDNVDAINNTINTKETQIYSTINTKETALYDTINTKETEIYNTINTKENEIYNKILDEHNEINQRVDEEVQTLNDRITNEVTTLNETINTKEAALQEEIDTNASEISRVETESKARDNNLNTQINNAVNTLNNTINYQIDIVNDRIDNEVETLNNTIDTKEQTINNRIDDEVADLNDRIDDEVQAMDDKKVNRAIANTLITEIVAATESQEPTLKITAKNTITENATVSHLHFKAQGQIQTRFQDADHIVIDSTQIDAKNTRQDERLTSIEGRLDGHDDDIADLYEHDATHDRTLGQHADLIQDLRHDVTDLQTEMTDAQYDIGRLQTQNATQETHLTNLDELVQANADDIVTANQNISRNLQSITELQANKANKTFANLTNNKVVGTVKTEQLQNNEIIRLGIKSIDPSTETASDSILKVISSDNTIVATRDVDTGVIDLKANLDTDVNYFVTTEILSTTIPSENIIPLNTLTPTDKVNVEVHDIISDPEGTWARVESINELTETCVATTFKKHAQAVWGTIKGDIIDQQDLQEQFSDLETALSADITAEENARIAADQNLQDNINQEEATRISEDENIRTKLIAEEEARIEADNTKVDKTDTADQVYGTDANGNQITYNKEDFGKVDTVNSVQADANKNVKITSENIQIYNDTDIEQSGYTSNSIKELLQTIVDVINVNSSAAANRMSQYYQNTWYNRYVQPEGISIQDNSRFTYAPIECYVTFERDDGIILMAKVVRDFTSDNNEATPYESFIKDVENENLKLIGIPEQVGPTPDPDPQPDWEYYTIVTINSITSSDGYNPLVRVYRDNNNIYNVGFDFQNGSSSDNLQISGITSIELLPDEGSSINGFTLGNDYSYYDNENKILEVLNFSFYTPVQPDWSLVGSLSIENNELGVDVYTDINDSNYTKLEFINNSSTDHCYIDAVEGPTINYDNIPISLTPGQSQETIAEGLDSTTGTINEQWIDNLLTFSWSVPEESQLTLQLQDINGNQIDTSNMNNINAYLISSMDGHSNYNTLSGNEIIFEHLSGGDSYKIYFDSDEYVIDLSYYGGSNPENYLSQGQSLSVALIIVAKSAEEQSFDILNDVADTSDNYEGLGGTEQEVEDILDDILGNNE